MTALGSYPQRRNVVGYCTAEPLSGQCLWVTRKTDGKFALVMHFPDIVSFYAHASCFLRNNIVACLRIGSYFCNRWRVVVVLRLLLNSHGNCYLFGNGFLLHDFLVRRTVSLDHTLGLSRAGNRSSVGTQVECRAGYRCKLYWWIGCLFTESSISLTAICASWEFGAAIWCNATTFSDMDAKEATVAAMAFQLKELKEAARASQLAQRKTGFKAAVLAHKTAGAKRITLQQNKKYWKGRNLQLFHRFSTGVPLVWFGSRKDERPLQ